MGSLTDFKKKYGIPVYEQEEAPASSKAERPDSLKKFMKRHGAIDYQERAIQKQKELVDSINKKSAPFVKTPQTPSEKSFDAVGKALGNASWAQQKAVNDQRLALFAEGQKAREEAEGLTVRIQQAKEQAGKDRQSFYGPATTYGGQGQVAPRKEQGHIGLKSPEVYKGSEADKTVEQLEARQKDLKLKYWSSLFLDPKFGEKSAYVPETDDWTYRLVNGDPVVVHNQDHLDQMLSFVGLDKRYLNYLKADEISLYNYVYATQGRDAATDFMDAMRPVLYARQRGSEEEDARKTAEDYPVLSSTYTMVTSPLKGVGYVGQTADFLADGNIDQNAPWNRHSYTNSAIRDTVGSSMGDVGNFFYQTGMSMADFVASLAASGGNQTLSLLLMGTGSASDTVIQAKDRGLSDDQAFALGTVAGAAEIAMEKIGMDNLFDLGFMKDKGKLAYILRQALSEGGEEVGTELINTTADLIISMDQNAIRQQMEAYMAQGMNENQAFGKALGQKALDIGLSGLGGFLSGGFMGSIGAVASKQTGNSSPTPPTAPSLGSPSGGAVTAQAVTEGVPSPSTNAEGSPPVTPSPTAPLDTAALMDETIAQLRGAPADPIAAALDTIRSGGTVTNRQASDILANANAVQQLVQQTGMTLPETASGKRAAVKDALATLAARQPTDLAPLSHVIARRDSDVAIPPATATPTVDTAPKISHNNKNETGGTYHADPERTELSGASEAGLPGGAGGQWLSDLIAEQMRLSGPASGAVGAGAEMVPGGVPEGSRSRDFGVQLRTSPVLRVSDRLQSAQTARGTNTYSVRDTTALPQVYADALTAGRNSDVKNGWCVTPKTAPELDSDGVRTIMNDTGTVGAGIAPNGDIVAVFKNKNGGPPRALDTLMPIIIEQGGDRLDCYGEILVSTYENYGFIPVARVEFNPEYANEGWDESKGHPWIYFMIHNGDTAEQVASKLRTYPHMSIAQLEALPTYGKDDYDSAMTYRDSLLTDRSSRPNDAVILRRDSAEGSPTPSAAPLGSPSGGAGTAQAVTEGVTSPLASAKEAPPVGASTARPTQATPSPYDSMGAAPAGFSPVTSLQYQYGTIPEGENPVRPDTLPTRDIHGGKVSYNARTVLEAEVTPDDFVDLLNHEVVEGELSYLPITNSRTTQQAIDHITRLGWTEAKEQWAADVRSGKTGPKQVAVGALLLNNAAKAGDRKAWLDILHNYQRMGTNTAQGLQALRILKTLQPSDKLYMIKKSIAQLAEDAGLDTDITIDPEMEELYLNAETYEEEDWYLGEIQQSIADQLPSTLLDKWNALRYLNMLGNFRTQVRNVLGNTTMKGLAGFKNIVATSIEAVAHKASGGKIERTRSFTVSRDLRNACREDFRHVKNAVQNGGKYNDPNAQVSEFAQGVTDRRQIFKTAPLEGYRKATNWAMEKGDLLFSRSAYARALAGYLKTHGVTDQDVTHQDGDETWYDLSKVDPETLDKARAYAVRQAQEITFRDSNRLSNWLSGLARKPTTLKGVKVVSEGLMPFRKTPANVLLRAEEYSPLGLINSLVTSIRAAQKGSDITAAQVIDSWAKSLTGTGVFALGMLLNSLGYLTAGPDEDDDKAAAQALTGRQDYAFTIPGVGSMTVDAFSPSAMPLLMGAELMDLTYEEGFSFKDLEKALTSITQPMIQMSMLQGVDDALDNVRFSDNNLGQMALDAALSYFMQGLTNTALGQLERSFEDSRMTTYIDKDSPLPEWLQRTLGKASAKIPGWDFQQQPYVDAKGQEEENFPTAGNLAYNALSPVYLEADRVTDLDRELERLDAAQDGVNVFLRTPDKTVNIAGQERNLTGDEWTALKKAQGQLQTRLAEQLIASEDYAALPDRLKAKALERLYSYAKEQARSEVLPEYGAPSEAWMAGIEGREIPTIIRRTVDSDLSGAFTSLTDAWKSGSSTDASISELDEVYDTLQALPTKTRAAITKELTGRQAAFVEAKKAGLTTESFTDLYRQYRDIEATSKTASQKAQDWSHALELSRSKGQISTKQRDILKDKLYFADTIPQDADKYDSMVAAGIPAKKADYVSDLLAGILPEDGYTNVHKIQQMEAIVSDRSLTSYTDDLLHVLLSDKDDEKYDRSRALGLEADEYVQLYRHYLDDRKKASFLTFCKNELSLSTSTAETLYKIWSGKA